MQLPTPFRPELESLGHRVKTLIVALFFFSVQLHGAIPAERIIHAWSLGDSAAIGAIHDNDYWSMSPKDVAAFLPELVKWIPILDLLSSHPDQSWKSFTKEHDWTPFINGLPPNHPIRHRWGLSSSAAWILRVLSERRLIHDQTILPVLIDGISHPSASFTGADCFYALTALTKLYDGPLTSWGNLDLSTDPLALRNWFRRWLAANDKKSLIVTVDVEANLKTMFLRVAQTVALRASDQEHSLHGFSAPDQTLYHRVGEPLFSTDWDGKMISSPFGEKHGQGSVFICVRTDSTLISDIALWNHYPSWDILKDTKSHGERIYQHAITGMDWLIEVYCKRLTPDEVRRLSDSLNRIDFK